MVIYADDESFTFMTPEGHTLSAWITFSAHRRGGVTVAQAQALERTSDPFDELAYMLGGSRHERPVLGTHAREPRPPRRRARARGRDQGRVHRPAAAVATGRNVRHSATFRTMRLTLTAPFRRLTSRR